MDQLKIGKFIAENPENNNNKDCRFLISISRSAPIANARTTKIACATKYLHNLAQWESEFI